MDRRGFLSLLSLAAAGIAVGLKSGKPVTDFTEVVRPHWGNNLTIMRRAYTITGGPIRDIVWFVENDKKVGWAYTDEEKPGSEMMMEHERKLLWPSKR